MRRIAIVFQETGANGTTGFDVFMEGFDRDLTNVPMSEFSPAEFWGSHIMHIAIQILQQSGVVKSKGVQPNPRVPQ
jgi:hypothetical protein